MPAAASSTFADVAGCTLRPVFPHVGEQDGTRRIGFSHTWEDSTWCSAFVSFVRLSLILRTKRLSDRAVRNKILTFCKKNTFSLHSLNRNFRTFDFVEDTCTRQCKNEKLRLSFCIALVYSYLCRRKAECMALSPPLWGCGRSRACVYN